MNPKGDKIYNQCFYISVCHVCKQSSNKIALKQCSGCRMITYCSRGHQKEHWPEHKDICKAINHVRTTFAAELSAYQGTPHIRKFLIDVVTHVLERELKYYESQMFLYPKMCLVCYKLNDEVECCPSCMTVWYCSQHKNNHDRSTCDLLKLCFEKDVQFVQEVAPPYLTDAYMRVASYETEFSNMKEFINIYGNINGIHSEISPHLVEIKQSFRLTRPLTIFYGIRVLDCIPIYDEKKTELVLHVIAANKYDQYNLREWEILLHIFPNLVRLNLVLIGLAYTFLNKQKVCDICVRNKKSFLVEWQNISYEHYVCSNSTFTKPDLVIRFQTNGTYDETLENVWKSSVKYIAKQNCPLLVCHPQKSNKLDEVINSELGGTIEFRTYKNPFASLEPEKEYDGYFDTEYENKYLTVYKTLCPQ